MSESTAELLSALESRLRQFPEGVNDTPVPYLQVIRRSQAIAFSAGVLSPSFCLIVQGQKRLRIGTQQLDYGPGDFITALIDVPAVGEIRAASSKKPYLGMRVELTSADIAAVVADAHLTIDEAAHDAEAAAFVGRAEPQLLALHLRLLALIERPTEAIYLSSLLKRELVYRLLIGRLGHRFMQKVLFEPRSQGVASAIAFIRDNYARPLSMEVLARKHGLSVSGLHHKFKAVMQLSPLQYQKQLRLLEARRLMLSSETTATSAALQVGYESPSQFSREYRRYFGCSPRSDALALRGEGALEAND